MALILVLGGTGTFGRLAVGDLLVRSSHSIAVACRRGILDDHWPPGSEGRLTSHLCDVTNRDELMDLVQTLKPAVIVHAAGPYFAIGRNPLEVSLTTRTAYVDLCPRTFHYRELELELGEQAKDAGVPVLVGCSTVGGITGLLTRRAGERMERIDGVQTYLSVHNFGWGGGLVSDYLRTVANPTENGRLGSNPSSFEFPDGTVRTVAVGDTLEHVFTEGLCEETTHWFGLNAKLGNWAMRIGERLAMLGLPVWHLAGLGGWLIGILGGRRTDGILLHEVSGIKDGVEGILQTTVIRPYGNVRNPAVLAALAANEIANGTQLGVGFLHPASWMEPERIVSELIERANVVETNWKPRQG